MYGITNTHLKLAKVFCYNVLSSQFKLKDISPSLFFVNVEMPISSGMSAVQKTTSNLSSLFN